MLCWCLTICVCASGFPSSRWWENAGQEFLFLKSRRFLPLTLLSAVNAWQTHSRNVRESIRDYRQQRMKTYKVFHTWCQDPVPSPYGSPLPGNQGLQQPKCLPEGQSHSGGTIAALLWCLCVVTSCPTSTLINFVNDRSMRAREGSAASKLQPIDRTEPGPASPSHNAVTDCLNPFNKLSPLTRSRSYGSTQPCYSSS